MSSNKLLFYLLSLALFMGLSTSVSAQTESLNKELKRIVKILDEDQQQKVIKYAATRLSGKEDGIKISDAKTLKKHFMLLTPKNQGEVLKYAKAQVLGEPIVIKKTPPRPPARPQASWMTKAQEMPKTQIQWEKKTHDFGEIKQGASVTHTFRFKNVGDEPLLLTRVKASCGCTTPSWSREEVAPGEEGEVTVKFNSRGKMGYQSKSVTVTGNTNPMNDVLRFTGKVVQ